MKMKMSEVSFKHDLSHRNSKVVTAERIERAAEIVGSDRGRVALALGVSRVTLNKHLQKVSFLAAFNRGVEKHRQGGENQ